MQKGFFQKFLITLDMIKVQHSLFAMPFAVASLFYATKGSPDWQTFLFIVVAMVTARNAAMSFNRIVDLAIDRKNPRTKNWPLVRGDLSRSFTTGFCIVNCGLFLCTAFLLNSLAFFLSPIVLIVLLGYSFTKRFTHFTQIFLGLALGLSPLGAWIAATGLFHVFPVLLGLGVLFWVAGFDLIYSTQDYDFDKSVGVKNLVVRLGIKKAFMLSKIFHGLCFGFFFLAGGYQNLGFWYFLGIFLIGGCLVYEHRLVGPKNFSKINKAFFTMNGYIALSFLVFSLLDIYL